MAASHIEIMSSHIAIVESLRHAAAAGESVVLATVVRVVGSSYGGVGTRMVIRVDGSTVGLVSGGCLESDLCAHALEVHSTARARLVTYDTRADDDAVWGLGLGCNGLIDVLLQPLSPEQAIAAASLLWAALSADEPSVISTVIPSEALAAGSRDALQEDGSPQIALEVVVPAVRLLVCGSGPDAAPVCRLARGLGWQVSLVDHRAITAAHARRFPGVAVIECPDAEALAAVAPLGRRTAAVVMSHHFGRDIEYVRALLAANVAYVGVLGPRARMERMLAELATRGDSPPDNSDALFGPVGLDLGGDGPEAIALAIIAEVSAVMHQRDATHLRDRLAALHQS
jgi:xanthine/CO dehydrogenase XdhC/CoxF family maturation factor